MRPISSHSSWHANGQIKTLPGALHFVTGNIINRIPIFERSDSCESFLDVFADLLNKWPCKLIAYVLMPEHNHLIVNPRDGDIRGFAGALKSLSARSIVEISGDERFVRAEPDTDGSIHQVWQESFKALALWSDWMIWQKINYIHANPVRSGLVDSAKDYPWSSFRAFYSGTTGPLPLDQDWWWAEDSEKLSRSMKELGWRTFEKKF